MKLMSPRSTSLGCVAKTTAKGAAKHLSCMSTGFIERQQVISSCLTLKEAGRLQDKGGGALVGSGSLKKQITQCVYSLHFEPHADHLLVLLSFATSLGTRVSHHPSHIRAWGKLRYRCERWRAVGRRRGPLLPIRIRSNTTMVHGL